MSGLKTADVVVARRRCVWMFRIDTISYVSQYSYLSEEQARRAAAAIAGSREFTVFMEHADPARCPHPR